MKVAVVLPSPNDASSLFRGAMPLALLARQHPDLELVIRDAFGWSDLARCDLVFLQRPCVQVHHRIATLAKQLRLPLWVDYDDAIDLVPCSNPKWTPDFAKEWKVTFEKCLELADVATLVNDHLAARAWQFCRGEIITLPNAHNDYIHPLPSPPAPESRRKVVLWRGGSSHDEDLMMVLPQLAGIARQHPDWQFHFVGTPCWEARRLMPRENSVFATEWQEYFDYFDQLTALAPAIQIVPWCDNAFNRCKSNLAWLEATAIGAAVLAPAWADVFALPGVWHYDGTAPGFGARLEQMMATTPDITLSTEHLRRHYRLSQLNGMRCAIIQKHARKPSTLN